MKKVLVLFAVALFMFGAVALVGCDVEEDIDEEIEEIEEP